MKGLQFCTTISLEEVCRRIISLRSADWPCFRILCVIRLILNCTLYFTDSQLSIFSYVMMRE